MLSSYRLRVRVRVRVSLRARLIDWVRVMIKVPS
jgi:hypothetical protein